MKTARCVVIATITFVIMKIRTVLATVILIITTSAMFNVWNIGVNIGAKKGRRRIMRLIDADTLKEQFTEGAYTSKGVREVIDNAPTVEENWKFYYEHGYAQAKKDFSRPHGVWIFDGVYRDENNPFDNDMYHCNLCKRSIMTACIRPEDLFPFCHCGADMRKGEEE